MQDFEWTLTGETGIFWVDLTTAGLINGGFSDVSDAFATQFQPVNLTTTPSLYNLYPTAKIGAGNFVYVHSFNATNEFSISALTYLLDGGVPYSNVGLTVSQAHAIDVKMDDGFPLTGSVTTYYLNTALGGDNILASGGGVLGISPGNAATPSATSCYDNGGNASNPMQYSMSQNNGAGINCALTFRFQ